MEFGTTERNEVHASQFAWLMKVFRLLSSQPSYPTGEHAFPDVLCRTLVADLDVAAGRPASNSMLSNFLDYFTVQFSFAKEINEAEEAAMPPVALERIYAISAQMSKYLLDDQGVLLLAATLKAKLGDPPYMPRDVVFSADSLRRCPLLLVNEGL